MRSTSQTPENAPPMTKLQVIFVESPSTTRAFHARACRAELTLAATSRDTLALVIKDRACAKWVAGPQTPGDPQ